MPNDRRSRGRSSRPGVVAITSSGDPVPTGLARGRHPIDVPAPDAPWSLVGELVVVAVIDEHARAAALDAVLRGADAVVRLDPGQAATFLDDLDRLGIERWRPDTGEPVPAAWAMLLDALADGATTEEAARRCHLSVRSAHRRLADARAALGVSTTAAAVARWSSGEVNS